MTSASSFVAVDCALFAALAVVSVVRIISRLRSNQQMSNLILILAVYAASRSITLLVIATGHFHQNRGYSQNLLNSVPATLFALFQTALIWRWVRSTTELSRAFGERMFAAGDVVRFSSLALGILQPVLVLLGLLDVEWLHYSNLNRNDWNLLLSLYSGFLFIYNGIAFLLLGLLLFRIHDFEANANHHRILLIAVVFSTVTFLRGTILVLYLFKNSNSRINAFIAESWMPATAFLTEWISIVLCIFVIPATLSQRSDAQRASLNGSASTSDLVKQRLSLLINGPSTPRERHNRDTDEFS